MYNIKTPQLGYDYHTDRLIQRVEMIVSFVYMRNADDVTIGRHHSAQRKSVLDAYQFQVRKTLIREMSLRRTCSNHSFVTLHRRQKTWFGSWRYAHLLFRYIVDSRLSPGCRIALCPAWKLISRREVRCPSNWTKEQSIMWTIEARACKRIGEALGTSRM